MFCKTLKRAPNDLEIGCCHYPSASVSVISEDITSADGFYDLSSLAQRKQSGPISLINEKAKNFRKQSPCEFELAQGRPAEKSGRGGAQGTGQNFGDLQQLSRAAKGVPFGKKFGGPRTNRKTGTVGDRLLPVGRSAKERSCGKDYPHQRTFRLHPMMKNSVGS